MESQGKETGKEKKRVIDVPMESIDRMIYEISKTGRQNTCVYACVCVCIGNLLSGNFIGCVGPDDSWIGPTP